MLAIVLGCFLIAADGVDVSARSGLAAEQFEERSTAEMRLWAKGRESMEELEMLAESGDPEVAWRARRLLKWIGLEVTPDTPSEVVELLEKFLRAESNKERSETYEALVEHEAYVQLFRLPDLINDEKTRKTYRERVSGLAGRVARAKLREGKDREALEILGEAKGSQGGLMKWVSLASALGLREEFWDDLTERERVMWARWEGNRELLDELVPEDHEVRTTLAILDGDPTGFLKTQTLQIGLSGDRARLMLDGWEGRENPELVAKLVKVMETGGAAQAWSAMQVLAQCGYRDLMEEQFVEDYPVEAFAYYEGFEQTEKALAALGLKAGEWVPREWLQSQLEVMEGKWDPTNEGCRRILMVADFYRSRGLQEEGERLMRKLGESLEKPTDQQEFVLFLMTGWSGTGGGFGELGIELAKKGEEDGWMVQDFREDFFALTNSRDWLLGWMDRHYADWDFWEKVRVVLSLQGVDVKVGEEVVGDVLEKLETEAIDDASEAALEVLAEIAQQRGDMVAAKRAYEELLKLDRTDADYLQSLAFLEMGFDEFGKAAELWLRLMEAENGDESLSRLRAAVCYQLDGQDEKADELLEFTEKFSLGDAQWLLELGFVYGQVGQYELQVECLERATLTLQAGDYRWRSLLGYLSDAQAKAGHWKAAAATREVLEATESLSGRNTALHELLEGRGRIEFARGMAALEEGDTRLAQERLDLACETAGRQGFFADDVFYHLNQAGYHEEAARLWRRVKDEYIRTLELYPGGHNGFNTAAWVASRAWQDLDEAGEWVDRALELVPDSPAYLDTKAEVFFAKGERERALEWSDKACRTSKGLGQLLQLRAQYWHFRDDEMPR